MSTDEAGPEISAALDTAQGSGDQNSTRARVARQRGATESELDSDAPGAGTSEEPAAGPGRNPRGVGVRRRPRVHRLSRSILTPTRQPRDGNPCLTGVSRAAAGYTGEIWKLAFADEFDGTGLDTRRWSTCFPWSDGPTCTNDANLELELYTPDNVGITNGSLRLQARCQRRLGSQGRPYNYTSGMISTGGVAGRAPGFAFTYGYVEARVRVPKGQGLWPALWMLPTSHAWPPEIDVMAILGSTPTRTTMTYHYLSDGQATSTGTTWEGPDFSAAWHTFAVDWEPNAITWYVDGVQRARYANPAKITDQPCYLLLTLAVGGSWPGSPNPSTVFPSNFLVDYVRVWQKSPA